MKTFGGHWSKGDLLTLIGVIAGILAIPAVSTLIERDFMTPAPEFSKAASADLDPQEKTCLDESTQVIPAGVAVCATLHGSWLDGSGPLGPNNRGAMAIWTRQAHFPFAVLTSPLAYQRSNGFQEGVDYVVCVEPPEGAARTGNISNRMSLDVVRKSAGSCLSVSGRP
jgi:hypothetical protein